MPELPDLTAYLEAIAERAVGERLEKLRFVSPFVLRSVDPPATELEGRKLEGLERLGKRIVFVFEGERFLVLHLMIAGRLLWRERTAKPPGKIAVAALEFTNGALWLTEAGSKKRAAIHLVRGRAALAAHDPGGIEPLTASPEAFRAALTRENRTLKRALTDPSIVAGIGNAYSDEILHAARLSPFARTADLEDGEWAQLYTATNETLEIWIERLRAQRAGGFPAKVTAFRPEMAVHGRYGQPCPRCGGAVQRIIYADNEANYCPACQTGGKLLADRVLSQLLKKDWPRSLEELEEKKERSRRAMGASLFTLALLAGAASGDGFPFGPEPARRDVELVLPLPPREADPVRLERALDILAGRARGTAIGPYRAITDVADSPLFARASRLAETFDDSYRERYGLTPVGRPKETVILFAREADYRRFQGSERQIAEIGGASGLAGGGIAATWIEGRDDDEVLATLAHELAHLANRRAIGPALPPWLDEGIADELESAPLSADGRLAASGWSRLLKPAPAGWTIGGGEATLRELAIRPLAAAPPEEPGCERGELERVLALDWSRFATLSDAPRNYTVASVFLRALLADAELAPRFRAWLAEVATGAPPDAAGLPLALGLPWSELSGRLRTFVLMQYALLPALPKLERNVDNR